MYQLIISPRAQNRIKKFPLKYKKAIAEVIEEIKENPFLGKPLERDLKNKFSWKVGPYRLIYQVNKTDKIVNLTAAGHRGIIYN